MRTPSLTVAVLLAVAVTACSSPPANRPGGQADSGSRAAEPKEQLAESGDVADPDSKICKITQVTGTRIQKAKVCLTAREWDDMARTDRGTIEESQRDAAYGIPGGN